MRRTKKTTISPDIPFVVYVTFPSGLKEYAYLCSDPEVKQGSIVIANGTRVPVLRTAAHDARAIRYITADHEASSKAKRAKLIQELLDWEHRENLAKRFAALKSPEAKRLVAELKRLGS